MKTFLITFSTFLTMLTIFAIGVALLPPVISSILIGIVVGVALMDWSEKTYNKFKQND